MDSFAPLVDLLRSSSRVVGFTGAGVSTESGIPDFRSPGGVLTRYDPTDFTFDRYVESAEVRARSWEMRREFFGTPFEPNPDFSEALLTVGDWNTLRLIDAVERRIAQPPVPSSAASSSGASTSKSQSRPARTRTGQSSESVSIVIRQRSSPRGSMPAQRPTLASAVAAGICRLLKAVFARARPDEILLPLDNGSFPSGHATNAAVIAVSLGLLLQRAWVWVVGMLYLVAMSFTRTYLGAHWITDTVGGALLGAGVALLVWCLLLPKLRTEPWTSHAERVR